MRRFYLRALGLGDGVTLELGGKVCNIVVAYVCSVEACVSETLALSSGSDCDLPNKHLTWSGVVIRGEREVWRTPNLWVCVSLVLGGM